MQINSGTARIASSLTLQGCFTDLLAQWHTAHQYGRRSAATVERKRDLFEQFTSCVTIICSAGYRRALG